MVKLRSLLIIVGLCGALVAPAHAQAPIRQGVTSQDVANQTQALLSQNAELRLQIGDMERQIAELRGKVETLEFLLGQTRDEVNRMQGDDARIGEALSQIEQQMTTLSRRLDSMNERVANVGTQSQGLELGGEARTVTVRNADGSVTQRTVGSEDVSDSGGSNTTTPQPETFTETSGARPIQTGSLGTISASDLPGEAGPLFAEAKSRLLQFDYVGAEAAFTEFLARFGDDAQAGEAQYWLAEVLYQQEEYEASGSAYTQMIQAFPDDPRAPDALVKLARAMRLMGEAQRACNALNALPQRYPNASGVTVNLAAVERTRAGCDA
ncbi:MAG: tol-pal system protein YbgF [Hyphomonadaceae bacterium]|nr:tol-pal system protein YbgF [Hyphomonadaceae bacterium]